jgi:hypothetical protein
MQQRSNAKRRGIGFEFTYPEWVEVWLRSGHFGERGKKPNQYVMARKGDAGSYCSGNVKFITNAENRAEHMFADRPDVRNRNITDNPMKKTAVKLKMSRVMADYHATQRQLRPVWQSVSEQTRCHIFIM